jgi:Hint domain
MSRPDSPLTDLQRSRRNLMRMGAIIASAIVAKTSAATAEDFQFDFHDHKDRDQEKDKNKIWGSDLADRNLRDHRCFLKGTAIRTVEGDRKIEDLAVGDLLPTVFGGIVPIQWIGRHRFKKSDPTKPWVRGVQPIRIARSALGPDVPCKDLYVSKTHALLIDGVLAAAGNLVNGTTMVSCDPREMHELEFFHVKLAAHDVIYAEGAPCETLRHVDENAVNFADYLRRYGEPTAEQAPCAPLLPYDWSRGEIKSCLRSAISPWIDRRQTVDLIRDKLEARGLALLRQSESVS